MSRDSGPKRRAQGRGVDLHEEAGRPAVAARHLLKQDGVDAQPSGGVGGLAQQPRRQPDTHTAVRAQKRQRVNNRDATVQF